MVESGLIEIIPGKKGKPTKYKIITFCPNNEQQTDGKRYSIRTENDTENATLNNKHKQKHKRSNNKKEIHKEKYGEFENVNLSDDEVKKLQAKFSDYRERIEKLSVYMQSTGKKYADHYATILNWSRMDKQKQQATKPKPAKKTANSPYNSIYERGTGS